MRLEVTLAGLQYEADAVVTSTGLAVVTAAAPSTTLPADENPTDPTLPTPEPNEDTPEVPKLLPS